MKFEQVIEHFIVSHHLLAKHSKYILALSGGPDSVALLYALHNLGYNIEAAHCNFHLRGEESNRDENFCISLCNRLDIPLHIVHFDTTNYAQLHKVSIEMAARVLRYHWFTQLCRDINADGVCIAHHQDDQVETVLLNMLRGTGLKGLTGMKAISFIGEAKESKRVAIIRPMLCVSEDDVMKYLDCIHQDFVVDSSNLKDDVQRNKLRLDIIPQLKKVNVAAKQNILRMTDNLKDIQAIVDESLQKAISCALCASKASDVKIYDIAKIRNYVAPKTLLWELLSPLSFNRTQIEEISVSKIPNKEWLTNNYIAIISKGQLIIANRDYWEQPLPSLKIPEDGLYNYQQQQIRISHHKITDDFKASKDSLSITIDKEKAAFPLTLRPIVQGDRFKPFGMKGTKLVSDYLKDHKVDIVERHRQLALTDKNDKIIWLVGRCIDNDYKVTANTKEVLNVTLQQCH